MSDKVRVLDQRCYEQLAEAQAELAAVRKALRGYPDSDLSSLAETLRKRNEALEAALVAALNQYEELGYIDVDAMEQVDDAMRGEDGDA